MTILEAMLTPLREGMIGCAMLLFLLQGYLCLALRRHGSKGTLSLVVSLQFLVLSGMVFLFLDGIFHYGESDYPRTWPTVTTAFMGIPAIWIIVYELLSVGWLVWEFHMTIRFRREHLTPWSVKEAIDLLPAGVAFAEENGNVVLSNLTMKEIASERTGKVLTNVNALTEGKGDGPRVWQFTRAQVEEQGKTFQQLTAIDISAEARINEELQGKNQKLREIKRRLEIYQRNAEQIIISQELLNARMQVHNETGHVLLACRHYLDHPSVIDEEALLRTLKLTNAHLLKEYEEECL